MIGAVLLLGGVAFYVYRRQKNAAASSGTGPTGTAAANPDNTYEDQGSATAEFGSLESQDQALGNSVAAAQAAESGAATQEGKKIAALEHDELVQSQQIKQLQAKVFPTKKAPAKPGFPRAPSSPHPVTPPPKVS